MVGVARFLLQRLKSRRARETILGILGRCSCLLRLFVLMARNDLPSLGQWLVRYARCLQIEERWWGTYETLFPCFGTSSHIQDVVPILLQLLHECCELTDLPKPFPVLTEVLKIAMELVLGSPKSWFHHSRDAQTCGTAGLKLSQASVPRKDGIARCCPRRQPPVVVADFHNVKLVADDEVNKPMSEPPMRFLLCHNENPRKNAEWDGDADQERRLVLRRATNAPVLLLVRIVADLNHLGKPTGT